MDNNENGFGSDNNEEVSFVQEKIKPKTKKRLKKGLTVVGLAILAGVIFGLAARVSFDLLGAPVARVLGLEEEGEKEPPAPTGTERNEVTFPTNPATPTPTASPTMRPTPTPAGDRADATVTPGEGDLTGVPETGQPTPTVPPTAPPTSTATPTAEPTPDDSGEPGDSEATPTPVSPLDNYIVMVAQIRAVAEKVKESLVRVYSVTRGVNWMDDSIETKRELTGILMGENGVELLILTDYSVIMNADRIDVELNGDIYEGLLYNYDTDTNMAVVGVPLETLGAGILESVNYLQLGSSTELYDGEPVIAVGRPNGYYGAFEFGFVSHTALVSYIIDGELSEFTTDHFLTSGGDGVITDLKGRLVGLIPYTQDGDPLNHIIGIDCLKSLVLKLLNGADIPYFGIRSENIPGDILTEMGIGNGIYVNEAVAGSPAASAGIKKGDVILTVNDVEITGVSQFYEYLLSLETDTELQVGIYRSSRVDEPESTETVVLVKK